VFFCRHVKHNPTSSQINVNTIMAAQVVYADFNSLTPKRDEIYRNPNVWAQKPNQYQNQDVTDTRRDSRTLDLRRSAWSPCCSSCCSCLLFLLGCLIVAGLAAAVALPIIFKPSDSTSTTEGMRYNSNLVHAYLFYFSSYCLFK